jgi:opacity protein-like surface antigen
MAASIIGVHEAEDIEMVKIVWTTALFLGCVGPIMAQSNVRVNVFASGSFVAGSREFLMNSNNAVRTEYATGGKVGFRVGADLRENWAGEVSYSYGSNSLRAIDLNLPRTEREFETRVHQFLVNSSYYFVDSEEKWRPFATFGIGFYRFSPTQQAKGVAAEDFLTLPTKISSNTKFGANFGGGLEGKVAEHIGLRFDLRDNLVGIPRFGLPETPLNPGGAFYPVSGLLNNMELGIGVVFYVR